LAVGTVLAAAVMNTATAVGEIWDFNLHREAEAFVDVDVGQSKNTLNC